MCKLMYSCIDRHKNGPNVQTSCHPQARLQDRLMGMGYNSVAIHGDMERGIEQAMKMASWIGKARLKTWNLGVFPRFPDKLMTQTGPVQPFGLLACQEQNERERSLSTFKRHPGVWLRCFWIYLGCQGLLGATSFKDVRCMYRYIKTMRSYAIIYPSHSPSMVHLFDSSP